MRSHNPTARLQEMARSRDVNHAELVNDRASAIQREKPNGTRTNRNRDTIVFWPVDRSPIQVARLIGEVVPRLTNRTRRDHS